MMTDLELKGLVLVLTVIILGSGFLLAMAVRHAARSRGLHEERVRESPTTSPLPPNEIWTWPKRSLGEPGEWGGPTEVLKDFLFLLPFSEQVETFKDLPKQEQERILSLPKGHPYRFAKLYGAWRRH